MSTYRRWMHRVVAMLAVSAAAAVSGCADSESPESDPPVTTVGNATVPTTAAGPDPEVEPLGQPATTAPLAVEITIEIEETGVQASLAADVDPARLDLADPFGTFASCSGGRRSFGPYGVMVSSPSDDITAVSVVTTSSVVGPGIHEADVRIESRSGGVEFGSGTITLAAGWRSGTFLVFAADGGAISGSFECAGGDPSPAPLDPADAGDGVLDSVEVAALLRQGDADRVVGLAVDTARSPEAVAECPAVAGGGSAEGVLVVRVDGDQSVGAITTFELTDGAAPTMRVRVGGLVYEFDDVALARSDDGASGTFTAAADGVAVDGAFRCA